MARTSSATVRLVQKMNRQMKDGTYPIYIVVCFGGRVEKATGVSCLVKHWDAKRQEIKRGCPNAPVLNKMLIDVKQRILDKKNDLEYSNRKYTPGMLIENSVSDLHAEGSYWDICQRLMNERRLKDGSIRSYTYTYRKLCEFLERKEFIVEELSLGVVKDFATWLEKGGIKINTIKRLLGCVAAAWNYAISRKLADASGYPFTEFKYTSKYKEVPRDYFLEESHIVRLKEYWLNLVIERNGNLWHYRPGAEEKLHQRCTPEWGILFFLLAYRYNGSAPIDVALLKPSNFTRVTINNEEYWSIETRRKKTDRSVHIRVKRDLLSVISIDNYLGSSGHYVYPVINYSEGLTDRQILEQSHKAADKAIRHVRKAFLAINENIARDNVDKAVREPLVDVQRLVFYTARHSRASNYFNKPGATIGGLASMLSRSQNTIATYAHFLTKNEDLVQFDELSPI